MITVCVCARVCVCATSATKALDNNWSKSSWSSQLGGGFLLTVYCFTYVTSPLHPPAVAARRPRFVCSVAVRVERMEGELGSPQMQVGLGIDPVDG